jgi:hypothetical protein
MLRRLIRWYLDPCEVVGETGQPYLDLDQV